MEVKSLDYDFTVCRVKDYLEADFSGEYWFAGKTEKENFNRALKILSDAGHTVL